MTDQGHVLRPTYTRDGVRSVAPRLAMPDGEMEPTSAYQLVHDEVMLDGNSRLNLATFVATWMGDEADRLYAEVYDKNMVDKDEYPRTAAIEENCWRILGSLWNVPDVTACIGTSTVGSSEACMLGGLALKRRWQLARRSAGMSAERPNLVMSSAVQVCWEKFCNYFEVEARYVPITAEHPCLDGSAIDEYVDENTIGVVAIMGVTYTGMYEPVQEIAAALDALQERTGHDVPIHVDGASGAMIAPFIQQDVVWDFRLERVHSISTSGHKYGLVYPGVGWVVWRTLDALPEELIFRVSYLGGDMPTLALNFSRPGAQVLLQYYQFLRLGREGYAAIQQECQDVAKYLAQGIADIGAFDLWNDGSDIPVFAWQLKQGHTENWSLYHLSDRLRMKGWLIPAYPMPDNLGDVTVQRIVVRNGVSRDLADDLLADIRTETEWLDGLTSPMPVEGLRPSFHH
ncbi:glutamate decarboxylase [Cellulosimicrobium terreum]|nr:glutamate decarboxylase [Cellulosimicrobium terreum]